MAFSKEHIPWNKGRPFSAETRKKISIATSKAQLDRHSHCPEETKRKISISLTGRKRLELSGILNPNWQGGKSFEPYSVDWTKTLRRSIRERDKYTCQICFNEGNTVHHKDYNKKNCNPHNLITLCKHCHGIVHGNKLLIKQ